MRVLFVVESLSPSENTGVAAAVVALARALNQENINVELAAPTSVNNREETEAFVDGLKAHLFNQPFGMPRTVVPALGSFLSENLSEFDLVHVHGLWRYPQWVATRLAQRLSIPYIVSPHGMCEPVEMARKGWKKKIYFNLVERHTLGSAAAIHAITNAEKDHCEQLQTCRHVQVIPNGVDIYPPLLNHLMKSYLPPELALVPPQNPVLLFMGRLHPKKGLDLLIPAFAQVQQRHPEARLVLAGPDPVGYRQALIELAHSFQVQSRVLFPGMVTNLYKQALLQRADLFALPSYSQGFSVAVLEALAAAKPVVISQNCYFNEVLSVGCGQVVDNSRSQLAQALNDLLDLDGQTRASMGQRGRELIEQKYTWPSIAGQMCDLYNCVKKAVATLQRSN